MPIIITYADQKTGNALGEDGSGNLNPTNQYSESANNMPTAIEKIGRFLKQFANSEARISYKYLSYRITIPKEFGVNDWIKNVSSSGETDPISLKMDIGAVISAIGLPAKVGQGLGNRGLAAIFRYSPGAVDFHFEEDGTLWLVHDDDIGNPRTILRAG